MAPKQHESEFKTITPATRVPLYVVGSAMGLAIYITFLFADLKHSVAGAVTRDEFTSWIVKLDHANRTIKVPPPPYYDDVKDDPIWTPTAKLDKGTSHD